MSLSKSGPFSKEEEIFIIKEFCKKPGEKKSPILVKRAFQKKFNETRSARALFGITRMAFLRVYEMVLQNHRILVILFEVATEQILKKLY